ncbi:hypothetical protein OMES3154_00455 [Oceanivirga miroungae]|uniref:Uncharacterized protein n=2 Tax=Oceanivirga miroungae TaxID=1130046 RepID=A0A6I8MCH2_9FUSO|nr:hypothetical protein OMES3154_00455 [Oceanivirga miroungae]
MTKYAYRDENRKNIIYANKATDEDRNNEFYCPNPNCNAKLYICSISGSKNAYFRATKAHFKHIKNCYYGNSVANFDSSKFDEEKFNYEDAINNILHNSYGEHSIKPPRTLRQIYSLCKSFPVDDIYADRKIGLLLLDDRSEYMYQNGFYGMRIIEAK